MQFRAVFHVIGWMLAILAGFMILPMLLSLASGDTKLAIVFGLSATVTAFVGIALILALDRGRGVAAQREGILLLVFGWLLIPFFAAFPLAATTGFHTMMEAWFEAVSGFTTTGATLIVDFEGTPKAIFLWRAILQWLGGFCVILAAAHVLSIWGPNSLPLRRPKLPAIHHGDYSSDLFGRIGQSVPAIAVTYSIFTFIGFVTFWAGGIPSWEALCLALSSVATGGFTTRAGSMSSFDAPLAETAMAIIMIISSINLYIHWQGLKGKISQYWYDRESFHFLIAVVGVILVVWLVQGARGSQQSLWAEAFNAVSLLTTSGYYIQGTSSYDIAPAIVLLFPMFIGGAIISTSGGLKVARLGLLIQHSLREMKRLSFPHGQFRFRYNEHDISEGMIAGVWALFLGFMAVVAITALVIGSAGFDFTTSMTGAIATVMNVDPALSYVTGGEVGFHDFPIYVNALLILAMIIGRVEVLAFLVLFNRRFWLS